ncbi:MAG: aminoglycoside phosphotransferase family protein [Anaerolineaceae bacterium]|nr:aminoglycoside phosphotransferase family protein [Anaerolineaceae bacterium]MDE0328242.1 aminoglycoside phosphotransferase family protein [Anaerolineaceae bacterium]
MLSEPALSHDRIGEAVKRLWERQVVTLAFLPPGGECSWGYRLNTAAGECLFLKLSQPRVCGSALCEQNLAAADSLSRALGAERIVSAWRSRRGRFLETIDAYQARLQPWVEGVAFMDLPDGPDSGQQRRLGDLVADIHSFRLAQRPLDEDYPAAEIRDWPQLLKALDAPATERSPTQLALADLLREAQPRMARWIEAWHDLVGRVRAAGHPCVFCHGDPSGGNVLVRPDGSLALVDLDAPAWAPRERDLFHLRLWPAALEAYHRRVPDVEVDAVLLRLYQLAWDIGEVVDYGWRALLTQQSVAQQRHDLRELRRHLEEAI